MNPQKNQKDLIVAIVAGLLIVVGGVLLAFDSVQEWPNNAFAMVIAAPIVIVRLIILLSKDATKTGERLQEYSDACSPTGKFV